MAGQRGMVRGRHALLRIMSCFGTSDAQKPIEEREGGRTFNDVLSLDSSCMEDVRVAGSKSVVLPRTHGPTV